MVIKLHGVVSSPPVRASMFTLDALNLSYEFVEVDVLNKGHWSPEFLKMNPLHTVPVLVDDDGFVVYDSHAINAYLVNKYAKDDKLYPKDPKKRSMVDRRMYFDDGILFGGIRTIMIAILREKTETQITEKMVTNVENNSYALLEKLLAESDFAAGNEITIADFSIATTLANANVIIPINKEKFPLIAAYMERCKENIANYEDVTNKAMEMFEYNLKHFDFPLINPKA